MAVCRLVGGCVLPYAVAIQQPCRQDGGVVQTLYIVVLCQSFDGWDCPDTAVIVVGLAEHRAVQV